MSDIALTVNVLALRGGGCRFAWIGSIKEVRGIVALVLAAFCSAGIIVGHFVDQAG